MKAVFVMLGILMLVSGCAAPREDAGQAQASAAAVAQLSDGGMRITFTGNNVYYNGGAIDGTSEGFDPDRAATLALGALTNPLEGSGLITGKGSTYPGSKVTLSMAPVKGNLLAAAIDGAIDLDAAFLKASGINAPVLAIGVNFVVRGNVIINGGVWLCTSKDQTGNCHNVYLDL